jgi:hypothetical protein
MKTFLKSILPPAIINFLKTINDSLNVFIGNISFKFTKVEYDFEVVEFRTIDFTDDFDEKWIFWSRIYEYPIMLKAIKQLKTKHKIINESIHNTCWGFQDIHKQFKENLEKDYHKIVNSDILESTEKNTMVYDITKSPKDMVNKFDFVINVSSIEEIFNNHYKTFRNLFDMVKKGGFLIMTFDLPGLQLSKFEKVFKQKMKYTDNPISGANSPIKDLRYKKLKVGFLVVRKVNK